MDKVKEYLAVTSTDIKEFNKLVNEHIAKSWLLQGGVSTTTLEIPQHPNGIKVVIEFTQALVK
ncbi:MAG TPA: hypothetical protein VNY73_02680 [Bacteroidia bacterium]|jgi:hypothetical protein|nr:hypothetical protein [Bacteroidia bacterium]